MGDYGSKASVPGFNVQTTADYLLSYSSSWPLLKMDSTGTFTGTVTHNLGYPPFFLMATASGQVNQTSSNYSVSSTVLSRNSGAGTPRYYICRLPLDQNYTAPIVPGEITQTQANTDYGIKVSKPGKDVSSADLRDFSLHSSTRSPMVQKVDVGVMSNTGGGLGFERSVSHGLNYTPLVFVFILPGTNSLTLEPTQYNFVPPPVGVSGYYYTVNASSVYITADPFYFSSLPTISVVVLKNPYTLDTVNRTYP